MADHNDTDGNTEGTGTNENTPLAETESRPEPPSNNDTRKRSSVDPETTDEDHKKPRLENDNAKEQVENIVNDAVLPAASKDETSKAQDSATQSTTPQKQQQQQPTSPLVSSPPAASTTGEATNDASSNSGQQQQQQQQLSSSTTPTAMGSPGYGGGGMQGYPPSGGPMMMPFYPHHLQHMQQQQQQQHFPGGQHPPNGPGNEGDPHQQQQQPMMYNPFFFPPVHPNMMMMMAGGMPVMGGGGGPGQSLYGAPHLHHAPPSAGIKLALHCDNEQLSDYQILVRQQLELFAAGPEDVESNTQGRKRQVTIGQVGLRCRHCASFPLRSRGRGAVYYPAKLNGVYQAAQNMAGSHLCVACGQIPQPIQQELCRLRARRDNASGGKQYWADGCRALGVLETDDGLRFRPAAGANAGENGAG